MRLVVEAAMVVLVQSVVKLLQHSSVYVWGLLSARMGCNFFRGMGYDSGCS